MVKSLRRKAARLHRVTQAPILAAAWCQVRKFLNNTHCACFLDIDDVLQKCWLNGVLNEFVLEYRDTQSAASDSNFLRMAGLLKMGRRLRDSRAVRLFGGTGWRLASTARRPARLPR